MVRVPGTRVRPGCLNMSHARVRVQYATTRKPFAMESADDDQLGLPDDTDDLLADAFADNDDDYYEELVFGRTSG